MTEAAGTEWPRCLAASLPRCLAASSVPLFVSGKASVLQASQLSSDILCVCVSEGVSMCVSVCVCVCVYAVRACVRASE